MPTTRKLRRLNDDELPEDLRPLPEEPETDEPEINEMIFKRFVACGGNPHQLNDAASIASAGLVIAEQLAELTTAVHTLTFLLCTTTKPNN